MTDELGARMRVVEGIDRLAPSDGRLFVVVGVFDGLHLGHAYLLEHLRTEAVRRRARPAVITFDHHPDEILTGAAPPLLLDPAERLERLERARVELTVVEVFDVALRMTPFDEFIRRIAGRVDLAGFLMTPDSAFGHDRGGTPDTVAALGDELHFDVAVIPALEIEGRAVRSAEIRAAIAAGNLPEAERLLGQPYSIVGRTAIEAGDWRVRVPMPVALPPAGDYDVDIEAADEPARLDAVLLPAHPAAAAAPMRGSVSIDEHALIRVHAAVEPGGRSTRITFVEPG